MKFSVFQLSRIGGREKNEDRMGYCYTQQSGLFVLADGMGGHPDGEVAAQLALQTVSVLYQQAAQPEIENPAAFLSDALLAAHNQILRHAAQKGMLDTPRTTLVAVILQGGRACWVHCGDSRLYVVRDGQLLMRTRDHSYAEHPGLGAAKFAAVNRNVLFTCLGSPSKPVFDVMPDLHLLQGDKLLLCSDGLWGNLSDADIVHQLDSHTVSRAVPELVEHALRAGGQHSDNVTVLAMEWETPDAFESTRSMLGDSVFASTIQATPYDGMGDDLDEAMIERSIAEINEAIRRSAEKRS
ncbi:MAG: PP2C family protein-serine/threonine phosphatase [Polaromonas sp.]